MEITITMNEEEIVTAIKDYLATQDVPTVGKDVEVNMVAGRGANGHSAVISVKKEGTPSALELKPETKPAPEKAAKPAVEKKKETPAPAPIVNPAPPAELFDDVKPQPEETPVDENTFTEGGDALFEEAIPVNGTGQEVDSLFN